MEELLAYFDAISPLSTALRSHIPTIMEQRYLAKKAFLSKAGTINRHVHFIVNGLLRCYKISSGHGPEEKEMNKWFYMEQDFVAYRQSYDNNVPSLEYYQALEPTTVLTGTFADLDNVYRKFPEFLVHGLFITGKFAKLWYNIAEIKSSLSATERYHMLVNQYPVLVRRVPLKHLASFLGMHDTTLSKIRSAF